MFKLNHLFIPAVAALSLTASTFAYAAEDSSGLYVQTGQVDTSILNSLNAQTNQTETQQALANMQQSAAQQEQQNKTYIQQVEQQIIQAGTAAKSGANTTPAQVPATPQSATANLSTGTATHTASSTPTQAAPATATGLGTSSTPDNGNSSGSGWNYGF